MEVGLKMGNTYNYMLLRDVTPSFGVDLRYNIYRVQFGDIPPDVVYEQLINVMNQDLIRQGLLGSFFLDWDENREAYVMYAIGDGIDGEHVIKVNDIEITYKVQQTQQDSPLNLYNNKHVFAVNGIWKNAIYTRLAAHPGIALTYSKGELALEIKDIEPLRRFLPTWLDPTLRAGVLENIHIDGEQIKQNLLRNKDKSKRKIPLFLPRRRLLLYPRVGYGKGFLEIDFKTKMMVNQEVNLKLLRKRFTPKFMQLIKRKGVKKRVLFNYYLPFIPYKKATPKGISAFHFNRWITQPTESDINSAMSFLEGQGVVLDDEKRRKFVEMAERDGLVGLETHFRARTSRYREFLALPRYVVPIIDFNNIKFFEKIIDLSNYDMDKLYTKFTQIKPTSLKAGIIYTLVKFLEYVLKDLDVLVGQTTKPIKVKGPLEKIPVRQKSNLDLFLPTRGPADTKAFEIINLPQLPIKIRQGADLEPLSLQGGSILQLLISGENMGKKTSPHYISIKPTKRGRKWKSIHLWGPANQFPSPLKIAIIAPPSHTNPVNPEEVVVPSYKLIKGVLTGDFEIIDPKRKRRESEKSPIKYCDKVLPRMYDFFNYPLDNVEVKTFLLPEDHVTIHPGKEDLEDVRPYHSRFQKAVRWGADLLIMVLPDEITHQISKYDKDLVYNWGFKFAAKYRKQIIHFQYKTFKRDTTFYAMCYSLFAHLIPKYGGTIYDVDLDVDFLRNYKKPGFLFYDFAGYERSTAGIIIAGTGGISQTDAYITKPGVTRNDALRNLGATLKKLIQEYQWDVVIIFKDNYYQYDETKQIQEIQANLNVHLIAFSILKRDKLIAFRLKRKYKKDYYEAKSPKNSGLVTPDDAIHLFPHETDLQHGIWRAVKFKYEWGTADLRYDTRDLIYLGTYLAKQTEVASFPHRQKIPTFIHLSDKLAELIEAGTFQSITSDTKIPLAFLI